MNTSSELTLSTAPSSSSAITVSAPVIEPPSASSTTLVIPTIAVRLNSNNFMLWRALSVPNFAGVRLHGFLDGSAKAPAKTMTQGIGDAATTVTNPDYAQWWTLDQNVLGHILSSMTEEISAQLIGYTTAAAAWEAVHAMFAAENRAGVRALKRQIQELKKGDKSAAAYMQQVKSLADVLAIISKLERD